LLKENSLNPRRTFVPGWTWAASLALHAGAAGLIAWFAFVHLRAEERAQRAHGPPGMTLYPIDLPGFSEGSLLAEHEIDPRGEPPHPAGGEATPRLDTQTTGAGGDRTVQERAVNLSDKDEQMRLSPDLLSRLDRDQQTRLKTSKGRVAWEDRRATTHPMELTFLASGRGERAERRTPSDVDPSRGVLLSRAPATLGGEPGAGDDDVGQEAEKPRVGAARAGALLAAPGVGVDDGRPGTSHASAARVMHARPFVTLGPTTVPAPTPGRPNDTIDSDQEVATVLRSLVHASTAGGLAGDGRGGIGGGGDPGAGGVAGSGSHPRPLGDGEGDWFDLNTSDPRLVPYFRRIHAKIDPLLADAFPKSAMIDLKQGTVILEVTIAADGTAHVAWPPLRPSGIDEFDKNCAAAIRKAAPFEPIPQNLGRTTLRVRMPVAGVRDW
jgi:TonB family protein